jgi:hypothetical protein
VYKDEKGLCWIHTDTSWFGVKWCLSPVSPDKVNDGQKVTNKNLPMENEYYKSNLIIKPTFTSGVSTVVEVYHVVDSQGSIWFQGSFTDCQEYLGKKDMEKLNEQLGVIEWYEVEKQKPPLAIGYKALSIKVAVKTPLGEGTGYYNHIDDDWLVELNKDITDELQAYKGVTHWKYISERKVSESEESKLIAKHFYNRPPDMDTYNKIVAIIKEVKSQNI